MRRNTLEEAEVFKELGCEVEEVDVVWNYGVFDAWQTHWRVCLLELPVTSAAWRYEMEPFVVHLLELGSATVRQGCTSATSWPATCAKR